MSGLVLCLAILASNDALADWFVARSFSDNVYFSTNGSNCSSFTGFVPAGGSSPRMVAVNPGGTRLYVTTGNAATMDITAIDTATRVGTPFLRGSPIAHMVASDTRLYTVGGAGLQVYDALTRVRLAHVFTPGSSSRVAVNHAATRIYVAAGADITVIDAATHAHITTVSITGFVGDMAIANDDSRVYLTNLSGQSLEVLDAASNSIIRSTPLGFGAQVLALDPAGTRLFAMARISLNGNPEPGRLLAIDPASGAIVDQRTIDSSAMDMAVSNTQVLVSQYNSIVPPGAEPSTVGLVMAYATNDLSSAIESPVGGHPMGIAVWDPPPPTMPPTIELAGVEVTQGIQDMAHGVRLVQRRRTAVRVFVKSTTGINTPLLTAYLYGVRQLCGTGACAGQPLGVLSPANRAGGNLAFTPLPRRSRINDSFVFTLPWEWTTSPLPLRLYPVLATPGAAAPACNSSGPVTQVNFTQGTQLDLQLVGMKYPFNGRDLSVTGVEANEVVSSLKRMFPVSDLMVRPRIDIRDDKLTSFVTRTAEECEDLSADERSLCAQRYVRAKYGEMRILGMLFPGTGVAADADVGYIMIPQVPTAEVPVGRSYFTRGASCEGCTGAGSAADEITAVHEIGHSLGRNHPIEGADLCGHAGVDPGYPYPITSIHRLSPYDPMTGLAGFDVGDPLLGMPMSAIATNGFYDLMGYCTNTWISDYTYETIYTALRALHPDFGQFKSRGAARKPVITFPARALAATPQPGDWLIVAGTLMPGTSPRAYMNLKRVDQISHLPARVDGSLSIRLLAANGTQLAAYPFTPAVNPESGAGPNALEVLQVVPFVSGTRSIQVVDTVGDRVLGTRPVSAAAPVIRDVTATAPAGGSRVVPMSWTASDADGDALSYDIAATRDGGANWRVIATAVSGTSADLDLAEFGGGSVALRVTASDGVLTAHAESPPFALVHLPPAPQILSPGHGEPLNARQNLVLEGRAFDAQDGLIPASNLVWRVDAQQIGTGTHLDLPQLAFGDHVISLTATNSSGLSATASVSVSVRAASFIPGPVLNVGPEDVAWQVAPGESRVQSASLDIDTSGTGALQFSAATDAGWLSLDMTSGTTPARLTLSASPAGFSAGTRRTATVTLTALGTPGEVVEIPVTLSVGDTMNAGPTGTASTPTVSMPVANAGTDQTVLEGSTVTLSGAASTVAAGHSANYQWTQVQGPTVTLSGGSTISATFIAPRPNGASETLRFELAVTDDTGQRAVDEVSIVVNALPAPPSPPAPPAPPKKRGGALEAWSIFALLSYALWRLRRNDRRPARVLDTIWNRDQTPRPMFKTASLRLERLPPRGREGRA